MIVGVDGNEANIVTRVGVNTYAYELLKNIYKLQVEGKSDISLIVYLKEAPLSDMPEETANFKYKVIPGASLWVIRKLMPRLIYNTDSIDIFFSPSHYLPLLASMPMVCSIMDLGYLENTAQFTKKVFWQLKWWTAMSIFVSKRVISISKSTSNDIVRHYPWSNGKVQVVYLAYDAKQFNNEPIALDVRRVLKRYSIVHDYVLYLGTLKPSKNIEGLIEAFSRLPTDYSQFKLVIAGKKGWMYESIFEKVKELGLNEKVIFTDFVPETDKPGLIKGAKVFVLPSFWEGFGLDVLNAMAAGTPVVVSNAGSLPEVAGIAGVTVDPNNIDSIAQGISKVLSLSKSDYNSMVERGLAQAKKFSWEKTARETLEIFKSCLKTKQVKN